MPDAEIGTLTDARKQILQDDVGYQKDVPVWEREDAPPGSTSESLLVFDRGRPVRVAGPTHFHHLADGRVVAGFSGGTHYSEDVDDGRGRTVTRTTRIVAVHAG